jgi:hypothetical protein
LSWASTAGVRATNAFDLGDHPVQLVADDGTVSDFDEAGFEVITMGEAVNELAVFLNETNLPRRVKRPLLVVLKVSQLAFERGNPRLGEAMLEIFCAKVRYQAAGCDPNAIEAIIGSCEQVLHALEHEPRPHEQQ